MIKSMRYNPSVIGLDIGRVTIKAAQVTAHDKGPRLEGLMCLRRTGSGQTLDEKEVSAMARVLERRGFGSSRIVLIAPTDALVSGSINLPPADSKVPRDKIVENELSRTHTLPAGAFEFAWWDLPPTASGSHTGQAHAIALRHRDVDQTLNSLSEMGLEVSRTVPASLALLAAAQRWPIDPRCISAVLDMSSRKAQLVLMHAGRVVHERALPDFDLEALHAETKESLGLNDEMARHALGRYGLSSSPSGVIANETTTLLHEALGSLVEEVSISFAYVSHLYPDAELGPLLLAGGGANLPGLANAISEALELETAAIAAERLLPSAESGPESTDTSMTAAIGAALIGGHSDA